MASKLTAVVIALGLVAMLALQPAEARALPKAQTSPASCLGVTNTLKKMRNMTITQGILSTAGFDIIFGPFSPASLVVFAPTDAAWLTAINALGINMKNSADKAALVSTFFYNMLDVPSSTPSNPTNAAKFGQPLSLLAGRSANSALGTATKKNLSITFTKACPGCSVYAVGAMSRALIKNPIQVCHSLVYVVDTVLLLKTQQAAIPVPNLLGLLSLGIL